MQLHELKPKTTFKKSKRVGRGGKRGTYSGKGQKGQKSRAGTRFQPVVREWLKKYHKLRGYNFNIRRAKAIPVNLDVIEKNFSAGETVSPQTLFEKKIIKKTEGKLPRVKILSKGDLTKSVIIERCEVSSKAKEIIEKQKGEIK